VRVLDAFTAAARSRPAAGARSSSKRPRNLDYVRGSHSYRAGLLLEGGKYRSDDFTNYLGTFTFAAPCGLRGRAR
jgi:hypothetical protein